MKPKSNVPAVVEATCVVTAVTTAPAGRITAWPLATSAPDSYLREVTGLKYIPVPVSALLPLGSRRQLANAEDLAEYADFGTLFTECGWAFDSNGRNAVNVAFEFIDNGNTFTGHAA